MCERKRMGVCVTEKEIGCVRKRGDVCVSNNKMCECQRGNVSVRLSDRVRGRLEYRYGERWCWRKLE